MGIASLFTNPGAFLENLLYMLPALFIGFTVHEWAHAYVAYRLGDPTAYNMGRMTLNPLKHIDPVGFLCLLLFRFGWAKPVPVNPRNFKNFKRDDVLVSLAGILMNLLMVVLFSILFAVLSVALRSVWSKNEAAFQSFRIILSNIISINLVLAIFNLIPIHPLDGSHLFEAAFARVLPFKVFEFLRRYGFILLLLLLWSGVLSYPINFFMSLVNKGILALITVLI